MKRYALVIGIGEYDSPNLGKLSKPANDARAIAKVLKDYGNFQEVTLLSGTKAKPGWVDYSKLYEELGKFLKQAANQDALIYFTGHGFTLEESRFVKRGYLATSSCQVEFEERRVISQKKGFSFDDLNGLVQEANLSSLLMLMDCCHSGFLIEDDLVKKSLQAFSKSNYFLIAACRSFQEAYALKRENHSVFTGALLESLARENAKQGIVTALNVLDFIDRELKGSGQEPIFLGMGGAIPVVSYQVVAEVTPDETCPYQGLEAFTEKTAAFFFGREKDVEKLWQALEQQNFVAVIGASGSGKSSLVRAGLILALKQSGTNWVVLEPMKPGLKPLQCLEETLEPLFQGIENQRLLDTCINDETSQGLLPLMEALSPDQRVLLVVDQFEELFTVSKPAQSRRLINLLCQVAKIPKARLAVVMTMRADFVEVCLHYEALKQLIQRQAVYVSPPSGVDLVNAITQPAQKQGYQLAPDLLTEIAKDTREEPGFLPLLQFALTKLWELRDNQNRQLTVESYQTIGRLAGALNDHANQIYHCRDYIDPYTGAINLNPTQERTQLEQDWIRAILLRLVRTSEGEKDTRQRQPRAGLLELAGDTPNAQQPMGLVLESLIKGRLLVSEQGSIDLAHEALILGWENLAVWCKESRELRRLSQRLEAARLEWEKDQQNPNLTPEEKNRNLMMGGLLAAVREQWEALQPYLQDASKDEPFWQQSNTHEQDRITTLQRTLTESMLREQASRALNMVSTQCKEALELIIQSTGENLEKLSGQILSSIQISLRGITEKALIPNILYGHVGIVTSVAISADMQTIVSSDSSGTICLWDQCGNLLREFRGRSKNINAVAISFDGQIVASVGSDCIVRLWSKFGILLKELSEHTANVSSLTLSPDGQVIASGSWDKSICLWTQQGILLRKIRAVASIFSVAISADKKIVVGGSQNDNVYVWNLTDDTSKELVGHKGAVQSVAISADGEVIASASQDFTLRLWNSQGTPLWQSQKYTGDPKAVTMSADGQIIASSGSDGSLYFLNREGREIGSYTSTGFVRTASMSPDGQMVVSGQGKTVCIWDRRGTSIGKSQEDGTAITALSVSSTGNLIAVGNSSGSICLWNHQGKKLREFQGHVSSIRAIAVSSNGQTIISGSDDSTIHLWDQYGNLLKEIHGHTSGIRGISISAEETVVSCSGDDTIRLWNYEGHQLGEFKHPGYVNTIAISADGKTIVSGSGIPGSRSSIFAVHLWNRQGNLLREHQEHEDSVHAVAINADGQVVVSAGGTQIIQWNLTANKVQKFHVHTTSLHKNIWTIAISADGQRIVSGGWDGNLRLWDQQGNQVGIFQGHNKPINAVAISSDGQITVTGGQDGRLGLWRSNWQSWLQNCCTRLTYHLISENPELEIIFNEPEAILTSGDPAITATQKACAACQKYAWSDEAGRKELAKLMRRQGNDLARMGKAELAVIKLRQAATYDPNLQPELEQLELP